MSEDVHRCTTKRGNAHRTDRREVLYLFHPWAGCIVHIHEVVKRSTADVGRCSRDGDATGRCPELPMWMFDRAACAAVQVETHPRVHIAALCALKALISQVSGGTAHLVPSNAQISCAPRISHDPNRGDSHATVSSGGTKRRETIRSVCLSDRRRRKTGHTGVGSSARRNASDANEPFDPRVPRPRKR
jgi:hypothetical protein